MAWRQWHPVSALQSTRRLQFVLWSFANNPGKLSFFFLKGFFPHWLSLVFRDKRGLQSIRPIVSTDHSYISHRGVYKYAAPKRRKFYTRRGSSIHPALFLQPEPSLSLCQIQFRADRGQSASNPVYPVSL